MSNLSPDIKQKAMDIDQATILWFKEDQEDWEMLKCEQLFKAHEVWDYELQRPDWHAVQREAVFIGISMEGCEGSD